MQSLIMIKLFVLWFLTWTWCFSTDWLKINNMTGSSKMNLKIWSFVLFTLVKFNFSFDYCIMFSFPIFWILIPATYWVWERERRLTKRDDWQCERSNLLHFHRKYASMLCHPSIEVDTVCFDFELKERR